MCIITEKDKKKLKKYILSHEQPTGGFSFSPTTPSTLEDTYFALRLLEELKELSINSQTVLYLKNLKEKKIS
ncbi:MAG: hypothetical protein QHH15_03315 [Candidatus Thermoplasmatota archaeon]|nr:hypothetical protein [Candidatus Thermoplasmatota archaeon]